MSNPPPGVTTFDHNEAITAARQNIIVTVFGATKTGKTQLVTRCARPLYIAYLDTLPEATLDQHLLRAEEEGYEGDVHKLVIPPIKYRLLTSEEAESRVRRVENFADWAKAEAKTTGGTFVLDGAIKLKGYIEKYLLGDSATLGYRAQRGQRGGPTPFAYAESNTYLMDFISSFAGSDLDVVLTWEGRRKFVDRIDENGRKSSNATDDFRSSMPETSSFAINVQVETLVEMEPIIVDNKRVGVQAKHKVRVDWGSCPSYLRGRTFPAKGFDQLKELLLGDLPADKVLDEPHEVVRANTEGLDG